MNERGRTMCNFDLRRGSHLRSQFGLLRDLACYTVVCSHRSSSRCSRKKESVWRVTELPPSHHINELVRSDNGQEHSLHRLSSSHSTAYTPTANSQKERDMFYLSIVLASCLAAPSLASSVARQITLCPWDGTGQFTMTASSSDQPLDLRPLALGKNGFNAAYYIAVFTLFFRFASPRS